MRRMFRETRNTEEEMLDRAAEITLSDTENAKLEKSLHEVFRPDPEMGKGGKYFEQAKAELGIESDNLSGIEISRVLKRARDIKISEKKKKIAEIEQSRKPELSKLREVEKTFSQTGVLKSETQAQQTQTQAQQSYSDKYQAAMQAAQELAASGFYTLEDAIRIVMANL